MQIIKKIPIYIHPFFWLFSALIGFFMSGSLIGTFFWIGIIFVSVLVHELGHAVMALIFKQRVKIQLVAMGGLTTYHGKTLKYYQQFLITLNGPLFGILLFAISVLIIWFDFIKNPLALSTLKIFSSVNLFWSLVNLIPVLPLDGGQLLRIALEGFFGVKGFKASLILGFVIATLIALVSFALRQYLLGALFFLFAFQSFELYRKSKDLSKDDRDEKLVNKLNKAIFLFQKKDYAEAEELLMDLRNQTHDGMIYNQAVHYLAFIAYEKNDFKKAYEYLLLIKNNLMDDAICLLHKLAFEENNFDLVKELSSDCYKLSATKFVALTNAKAFAMLKEAKPAGGWLKTAIQFGDIDLESILSEKYFDNVKNDSEFKSFFY
ncbi:MAG: site-2 protease family protein [Parachlamydiales bacterium]|jgi:Zn-dependent protease